MPVQPEMGIGGMTKRKGNAPGQGRQPTIAPRGQVTTITARVSEQQRAEYVRRGGSRALRDWLDGKLSADEKQNHDGAQCVIEQTMRFR